jgi:polyribonucleotide nucleotidyltransferase
MSTTSHVVKKEIEWGGRTLTLETGRIARQATGAVIATYGNTVVLCTVVGAREAAAGASFFPLSVHYQEKTFSVGKIPGGFLKRESKPSEREVLTSRLIDRPIRPLFPEGFLNEVQVICTVLSYDADGDSDIVAMIGASAALSISGIPFLGPIGCARVGYQNDEFVLNPAAADLPYHHMDLVVAGTKSGVLMVESEIAELSDDIVLEGVKFGHKALQPIIKLIEGLTKDAGKPKWELRDTSAEKKLYAKIEKLTEKDLKVAFTEPVKAVREEKVETIRQKALETFVNDDADEQLVLRLFKKVSERVVRQKILDKKRIDGRDLDAVRHISTEVGFLPRAHGSGLFTRGETQAIVVATLGSNEDAQLVDALEGEYKESFMLHYNFPPFSVGETGRVGAPGRREIGHGKLAWRAIRPVLPNQDKFPYTLRLVSEITESNGSSSMATVCGSTLALMDAGVPIERPVAGIAMGLVLEGEKHAVLSDILGDEDSLGDMDFKVAGTEKGITALQMDIKVTSVTPQIMEKALAQAKEGRLHILKKMLKEIKLPRKKLSHNAPRVEIVKVAQDKIRDIIGPGGKVIREICETTGAKIDINDDGIVRVFAPDEKSLDAALKQIKDLSYVPREGDVFDGKVVSIQDFGAFVNFMNQDGLVHISEISQTRVNKVADVLKLGDVVRVKVIGFDNRGKIKLSIKQAAESKPRKN